MAPVTRPRWMALLAGLAATVACEGDRSAGPDLSEGLDPAMTCSRTCVIVSTDAALAAARHRPDSASPVHMAEVLLRGTPGEAVSLSLSASTGLRDAFAGQGHVLVTVGGRQPQAVPLAALAGPVRVFTFDSEDTVRVTYHLARDLQGTLKGTFELVQHLSRGTVLTSSRPYARRSGEASLLGPCPVGSSTFGSVCGVTFNISPWAAGDHFGATFQSDPGSGASRPITVSFSTRAVKSVTVKIYDPTWAGNEMVARGVGGVELGRESFNFSNVFGQNIPDTRTISAPGIRSVVLIPSTGGPDGDYVAYDMNIVPDSACDPIWPDPWLRDPDVQQGMNSQWQAEWDKGFNRKEPGSWIFEDPATGEYELVPGEVIFQDQCEIKLNPTPPTVPGKVARAWWHGHVLSPDLPVPAGCRNYREGDVVGNGISVEDEDFAAESGHPGYGLDEDQLFKVEPNGNWNGMPWTKDNFCRP